jgi:hypothetical protein
MTFQTSVLTIVFGVGGSVILLSKVESLLLAVTKSRILLRSLYNGESSK